MTTARVEVRRAEARPVTRSSGIETRHSFSFGAHYDPGNVGFGALLACNEERLDPGAGYDTHHHAGVEIVTWVLAGRVTHVDSAGHRTRTGPGVLQRLSAGRGIDHSERNEEDVPLRFVQMWLVGSADTEPVYEQVSVAATGPALRLPGGPALHVLRPATGDAITIPPQGCVHLSVVRGSLVLDGSGAVRAGDALRVVGAAGDTPPLVAAEPSEILAWQMAGEMEES